MSNAGRMIGSVVAGGFVMLTGLSQAFAYEPGNSMCEVTDDNPDDGIDFICRTHEDVAIADGYVAGPDDAAELRIRVTTGEGGEPCNGTINCNFEFDTRAFYDVEPGGYFTHIPFPSSVNVACFCR